jgi:hypothetical protein
VKHGAITRDPEIKFEVLMGIPAKRPDAISWLNPELFERVRQAMGAPVVIAVMVAMRAAGRARYDFLVRVELRRTLEKMVQG